jgi:hypothetical protein
MNTRAVYPVIIATLATQFLTTSHPTIAGEQPVVRFDLAPVAPGRPVADDPSNRNLVRVALHVSSMIESAELPQIDQWLLRCQPRDKGVRIADYAPRTETGSDLAGPIQVKKTNEENNGFGLSLDGSYGPVSHAHGGADHAKRKSSTLQFDRIAPEQAVTASGTINRGRGVYFKLRRTAQQVLEGEKTFELTLQVPDTWRGSLLDVSVVAQIERKTFAGWDRETKTIGWANFVVAVYRQGDREAAAVARALSDAEYALRETVIAHQPPTRVTSLPSMLRQVAMKLDLEPSEPDYDWLIRLLLNQADPHLDKEISRLPMPVRLAVLDYADVRDAFDAMGQSSSQRVIATKPPIE